MHEHLCQRFWCRYVRPSDAASDVERERINAWFDQNIVQRLDDKKTGAIIVVTAPPRWREDQLYDGSEVRPSLSNEHSKMLELENDAGDTPRAPPSLRDRAH